MNKIKFKNGMCFNTDCMKLMKEMKDNSVDLTLTDIPYDGVNRKSNGLRNLDKGKADVLTFNLHSFLDEVYRVTKGTTIIFCGQNQLSEIFNYFDNFAKKNKGTVRQLVWAKCLDGNEMVFCKNNQTNIISRRYLKDIYRKNPNLLSVWNGQEWIQIFDIKKSIQTQYKEIVLRNGHVIKCSNEHKFYIQNKEIEARELKVGDVLDHVSLPMENCIFNNTILTKEIFWFIGHFIAEGSYSYDANGKPKTIQIATNKHNDKVLSIIQTVCKQIGGTYSVYDDDDSIGNGRNIHIRSKLLLAILSEYVSGQLSYGKHFSSKCFNISKQSLHYILQGYLDGDGYYELKNDRYRFAFTRKNYELVYDLQLICNILGYWITAYKRKSKCNGKIFGTWNVTIKYNHNNDAINAKNNYEIIEIKDKINTTNKKFYDIQLENNPHQYCLYDGVLTHNCNPSPMNGKYIYLSGTENAIWFKKKGATFNAYCKSNVFSFPCGRGKLHPTEKNHDLIKDLILDNSNEGEILFDPCAGGGTHLYLGSLLNRKVIGSELSEEYFEIIKDRFKELS